MIEEYQLLWKDILERITHLKQQIQIQIKERAELAKKQSEVDESVQVETLKFEQDTAVQVNTLPPLVRLTSITSKDAYIYELDSAIRECTANIDSFEVLVSSAMPLQGSPEIQTSGKTLAKLIATCQSSVELVKHLNQLLLSESNCTDEQARSVEVQNLITRFEDILIRARIREQKIRELRYYICFFIVLTFDQLFYSLNIIIFLKTNLFLMVWCFLYFRRSSLADTYSFICEQ